MFLSLGIHPSGISTNGLDFLLAGLGLSGGSNSVAFWDTLVSFIIGSGSGSGCLGIALALLDADASVFNDLAFPPFDPAETLFLCASFVDAKISDSLALLRRPFLLVKNSSITTLTTLSKVSWSHLRRRIIHAASFGIVQPEVIHIMRRSRLYAPSSASVK